MSVVSNRTPGAAMKCLACGAELMRLLEVRTDTTTPFAIERRIFQCSSCRQSAQRLGFDRTRMPFNNLPAITPSNAPTIKLQRERHATTSTAANAVETQSSRALTPPESHRSVDWGAVVGRVSITLKAQGIEARAATWARTLEKLRNRQVELKERAVSGRTNSDQGEPAPKQVASVPEPPAECLVLSEGP
jgi:hypothetical protein